MPTDDSGTTTLLRNGIPIDSSDVPGVAGFTLPIDPGSYRLVLDATRTAQPWPLSGHVHAEWTFGSARTDPATRTALDMLDIGIHLPLDQFDAAAAGRPLAGTVDVTHQQGSAQAPVRSLGVQVSYDDGKTWSAATVRRSSQACSLVIPAGNGKAGGFATLRATATDAAGNTLTETLTRAYRLS